ncbi:MAG: hypothetical protein WC871_02390 [Bacteroidales bacterium]|jgi:hypothetical protein
MLPPNTIIPFDGANADIPTGFARDTRFDDKFVKGTSSGFGDTGGALTHTHTSAAHSHTMVAHTHQMMLNSYSGGSQDAGEGSGGTDTGHSHHMSSTYATSTAMSGGTLSDTVAYPASTNLPAYYTFIFIKTNSYSVFPVDGIVITSAGSRVNASFHSDSAEKHMRGASTGEDAGDTGGSDTHTHNVSHTHTGVTHSHSATSPSDASSVGVNTSSGNKHATGNHSHTLYWNNYTLAGSAATLTSGSASNVPLSQTINLFKFTSQATPIAGDIAMTTETTTPVGWINCDGTNGTPNLVDYYVRNKASAGAGVSSTGSNTHSHAANNSHTHGTAAHTHTGSTSTFGANGETGVGPYGASEGHSHTTKNLTSGTASWNSTNVSASSTDNQEPPYIQVKFIQFKFGQGGAPLFAIL